MVSPDGGVDRRFLADIVFQNPDALRRLESLLYPRIAALRDALADGYDSDPRITAIVIDAPKLYEAGVDKICDAVVFVDAERSIRLERLRASRGWSENELARREASQGPLDKKRAFADYIVANNSSLEQLRPAVERAFASVLASFTKKQR
jgi:dephospho-CoA kinase